MAGPMAEGSSRFASIWTNPMRVPTIPKAGANFPASAKIFCPARWCFSIWICSVCRICRMVEARAPSAMSMSPFRSGSVGAFDAIFSSPRGPSFFRARSPSSRNPTMDLISSPGSWKTRRLTEVICRSSLVGKAILMAPTVPPRTMRMPWMLTNMVMLPPRITAASTITHPRTTPRMDALSMRAKVRWKEPLPVGESPLLRQESHLFSFFGLSHPVLEWSGRDGAGRRSSGPGPWLRAALLLLALLLLPTGIVAQAGPMAGLDHYVETAMADWEIPGLALAVVHGDSILHARGYGVTFLGGNEEVDEHTLFAIASTTKAMTSATLALLVDEGRLAWDDPVQLHLPAFQVEDAYVSRELTIRDLLTHRAGTARLDNLWIASPFDRAELLSRLRYLPLAGGFRAGYDYNNHLYIVAGEVVTAVVGQAWDDVLARRIFEPLGMERSTSRAREVELRGNTAHSHTRIEGEVHVIPRRDYDIIGGAGAVWSSAWEMAQWARLHLNEGEVDGVRVLSADRIRELHAPVTVIPGDSVMARLHPTNHFQAYALGWRLMDLHGQRVVHHSGSINYTRTQLTLVPDDGIAVVAMANLSNSNLQLALTHWILDALQGREPQDWSALYLELDARSQEASARSRVARDEARLRDVAPSLPAEAYVGLYRDDLFGDIRIDAGDAPDTPLTLHYSAEYEADLHPWHGDTFRVVWRRPGAGETFLTFRIDLRGRVVLADLDGFAAFVRQP
ncbi:MAG: serine hydrolase [Gemmatimonadales bacterium]|nr:MAG: serine hydrolase [Gemmatimonadales bacterium]